MPNTIKCDCGRILIWENDDPQTSALCPNCGQTFSRAVDVTQVDAAEEAAPTDEFNFGGAQRRRKPTRARGALYAPWVVGLAGLIGGTLASLALLGLNLYSLRYKAAGVITMLIGIVINVVLFTLLTDYLELPTGLAAVPPLVIAVGLQLLAGGLLGFGGAVVLDRFATTSGRASIGVGLGIGLGAALLVFGAQVLWNYPFAWGGVPPTRTVQFGQGQRLVYSVSIPKESAIRTGALLIREGIFDPEHGRNVDVFVLEREDHIEVRFFMASAPVWPHLRPGNPAQGPDALLEQVLRTFRDKLADQIFKEQAVVITVHAASGGKLATYR